MFDDLKEVTVREEILPPKSDLDKILDAEEEIIKQYENDERFKQYGGKHSEAYKSLYTIVQEKFTGITLTPELLQGYTDARENTEENTAAIILGMYSAALLEIISTTQPEKTTVIDGKNKTFNYLFYRIHNIKNLTLHNIKGNCILYNAGSEHGSAQHITLTNIIGSHTLYNTGSEHGRARNITLKNIKGNYPLYNAGRDNGSLQNVILDNITGDCTLENAGFNGNAQYIILNQIRGDYTLRNISVAGSGAQKIILNKIKGDNTLLNVSVYAKEGREIREEHDLSRRQKIIISKIKKISKTIHALSLSKAKLAHDEIARLQKEIFKEP